MNLPPDNTNTQARVAFDQTALEMEYRDLFVQRDKIQKRMDAIKDQLTPEEYQKLVTKIENPQFAKLYVENEHTK